LSINAHQTKVLLVNLFKADKTSQFSCEDQFYAGGRQLMSNQDTNHAHTHHHDHHHHHGLSAALWLTALFAVVELVGGFWANSLALLADAGHMVSDVLALSLAVLAKRIAARPAHDGMTYGYGRAKVLAAQFNGLALWFLAGWIAWEAVGRLTTPPQVDGPLVVVIGVIGLVINLIIMRWLHHDHDINTRAAYWHVMGDALGSVAAVVAGIIIMWTGWMPIDPILSFLVAAILIWGGWRLIRETTMALMVSAPKHLVGETKLAMLTVENVLGVHHIHIWGLPNGQMALSAHILLADMQDWPNLLNDLQQALLSKSISHATLQPELANQTVEAQLSCRNCPD